MPARQPRPSQLSAHRATRVELPGRYGPIAALHGTAVSPQANAIALLIPGYTGSKEDFAPLLDPISDAGIEPIAIDLPGQHESPGPTDEAAYRPENLGPVIAELIGKLSADGRRVLLLGHSFGGLVARAAVVAQAPIRGLTLLDSGPAELPAGQRRTNLELGEPLVRQHGLHAAQRLREQQDATGPDWAEQSEELKEFLRVRILQSSVAGLLGMADGLRREPDRVAQLARALRAASTPCLVVCGEFDDAWPVPTQRDMAERLDADFAVVASAKHSPNTENPSGLLATLLPTWHAWLGNG